MAVEPHGEDVIGAAPAQVQVGAALDDPESELALGARLVAALLRPDAGAAHCGLEPGAVDAGGRALVEGHRDVGAEQALDAHGQLGREVLLGAVVDRPEAHALVVDAAAVCRSENTWKPPESVRMGPSQPLNRCRPPSAAICSAPGRQCRW